MTKTKNNHYVPQWYQKGFAAGQVSQLCHLSYQKINLPNGELKTNLSKKWYTPAQRFYEEHLYSTFLGAEINDEIEKKLFGPIDDNGSKAVRAFLTDDQSQWHYNFQDFFTYLDAQKLRTPKGLDWIKSKYPQLTQIQLMAEMQSLRTIHCTLWAEGVRELVSAENSDIKFIISDHPVTIYNCACPPESNLCSYPNDPDIALKGSQTIFPLNKDRCLILTNLEYAQDPENANPLEQRTNPTRMRRSMVNTIEFINTRKLSPNEVAQINQIIKSRSKESIAAGKEEWLYPESHVNCDWSELRNVLLPPSDELYRYGGEILAHFDDGTVHYQDAYGRTKPPSEYLNKNIDESQIGRNDRCGCGSGRKYKNCCRSISADMRTSWDVISIRERHLAFCNCIRDVLGLDQGKTWLDVRRELSDEQVKKIYEFYSILWPSETDIYSLLPKSDGKFRGLYTGPLDVRVIRHAGLPMASVFDELLIESPIINPNTLKQEFSPISSPAKYKYQALKDFLFMLELEPYIGLGLVNLIPDPSEFDVSLMRAMLEMARNRGQAQEVLCEQDRRQHFRLAVEDLLNSTAMMPRNMRIKFLINQFGLDETNATQAIRELESSAETSPLTLLQQVDLENGGQFIQLCMGPNYEMALLIAQVTGSILVTDSASRWQELQGAQHRNQGIATYPWSDAFSHFCLMPIDEEMLDTFQRSQGKFNIARNLLKTADRMVLNNNRETAQLTHLASQVSNFMESLRQGNQSLQLRNLQISSPEGGFYDTNVQRLLARSNCLKYDHNVRSVYGIGI